MTLRMIVTRFGKLGLGYRASVSHHGTDTCLRLSHFGRRAAIFLICASLHVMAAPPEFEVASVKLNQVDGPTDAVPKLIGTRVTMHNVLIGSMILYAYHADVYQVVGGNQKLRLPDGWNWYDVEARTSTDASDEDLRLMFQSLLANRFGLKVHHVTQNMTGYSLRLTNGRVRPTPSAGVSDPSATVAEGCSIRGGVKGNRLLCTKATMQQIAAVLTQQYGTPVINKTGLRDVYDCDFLYSPDSDIGSEYPSLRAAIRDVLGLQLERETVPVEMLVIDKLDKPTGN